jgi:hypothetical protein
MVFSAVSSAVLRISYLSANEFICQILYISTLWGRWVFVYIRIVKSYVMNWGWSKSTFVLEFVSPVLVFYCTVLFCIVLCHSHIVWNMAQKCCLDQETWSTTILHKGYHTLEHRAAIQRRGSKLARIVILSLYGADTIVEVKLLISPHKIIKRKNGK